MAVTLIDNSNSNNNIKNNIKFLKLIEMKINRLIIIIMTEELISSNIIV